MMNSHQIRRSLSPDMNRIHEQVGTTIAEHSSGTPKHLIRCLASFTSRAIRLLIDSNCEETEAINAIEEMPKRVRQCTQTSAVAL